MRGRNNRMILTACYFFVAFIGALELVAIKDCGNIVKPGEISSDFRNEALDFG